MTTRILPQAEWGRLHETDIPAVLPYTNPEDIQVVVVEEGARIVGAWAVLRVVQLEGVWIAPEHRRRGRVAKRLMTATMELAKQLAPHWVFTGAQTPEVARLLTKHLGALKLPLDPYIIPLKDLRSWL